MTTAIDAEIPANLDDAALRAHPLAVWIELEIGLLDGQRLTRRPPVTIAEAANRLAERTGRDVGHCRRQLQSMLTLMSQSGKERGGSGDRAFLAFKLHRFFGGAGQVYATLRGPGLRRVTLDGQRFDPTDGEARLYPTYFCRNCGQEHHPVALVDDEGVRRAIPRSIDEVPLEDTDSDEEAGYLMPEPGNDKEYGFTGAPEDYPEEWVEPTPGGGFACVASVASSHLVRSDVEASGAVGDGWTKSMVPSRQISLLSCLWASAARAGTRDQ